MNNPSPNTKPTILLVEDDNIISDVIILSLAKLDCQIVTASNGQDALSRFQSYHPDLVIMDILLPWMNGLEVLREWKKRKVLGEVPVLIMSALGHREIVQEALDAGASDFLIKPFDRNILIDHTRRLLAQKSSSITAYSSVP